MSASNSTQEFPATGLEKSSPAQTIVKLNVGGVRYESSLRTLMRYPESMFATWFANWKKENQEEYFIDFDGEIFKFILEFLRYGESAILPKDDQSLQRLHQAADYFQLPRFQLRTASLVLSKQGLRGTALSDGQLVKLSPFGVARCLDSYAVACLNLFYTACSVPNVGGGSRSVRILELTTALAGAPNKPPGCSVCCPACSMDKRGSLSETPLASLDDVLQKHRDVFQSQITDIMMTAVFQTSVGESDCVTVMHKQSNRNVYYHVAKCFLMSAE